MPHNNFKTIILCQRKTGRYTKSLHILTNQDLRDVGSHILSIFENPLVSNVVVSP